MQVPQLLAGYLAVLAMSEYQLQRKEQAAELLAQAEDIMTKAFPGAPAKPGPGWAE